jgi:hypothetical protein
MALIIRFSDVGLKNDMYWRTVSIKSAWLAIKYAGIICPVDMSLALAAGSESNSSLLGASQHDAADARELSRRAGSTDIVSNLFGDDRADRVMSPEAVALDDTVGHDCERR